MTDNVCWHDGRMDVRHWKQCSWDKLILWGRCRSGRRWFWVAKSWRYDTDDADQLHGWTDTEDDAFTEARSAVTRLALGHRAVADLKHGVASQRLKEINTEKRKARPSNGSTGAGQVEHLYGAWWNGKHSGVETFRVTKKTPRRIYYVRREGYGDEPPEIGFVDRQKLEADGDVYNRSVHWSSHDYHLYAEPPEPEQRPDPVDREAEVARLKTEMADAHPDRGGTNQAFIAAHRKYKQARRAATKEGTRS